MKDNAIPTTTPWGKPQDVTILAPGIVYFDTPATAASGSAPNRMPESRCASSAVPFAAMDLAGWYEEDQDLDVLARIFPDLFGYREGYSESLSDDRPVKKLQLVTDKLMQDRPQMSGDELEGFVNAHAIDGVVFKLLKNK